MTISGKSVFPSDEALNSLGKTLWNDFQTTIAEYTTGWLTEDYLIAEDYQELLNLVKSVSQVMEVEEDFAAFEKWLTSGFIPDELVVSGLQGEEQEFSEGLAEFDWGSDLMDGIEPNLLPKQGFGDGSREGNSESVRQGNITSTNSDSQEQALAKRSERLGGLRQNETTHNQSGEKRSLQNDGVKGLQDLAQLLENSQTGTEIFPKFA
ncbi:MAG: hypothetical protein F6K17_39935, partial [Okeania sp. SIO3C4]|nr:hypothetical protein [Okeania sp. SIO3C4]